jgi:hypothetical protein
LSRAIFSSGVPKSQELHLMSFYATDTHWVFYIGTVHRLHLNIYRVLFIIVKFILIKTLLSLTEVHSM